MDFRILLDTACSIATTGYDKDFCGQLAYGRFGIIKTADGMAEIKGFGMVHWETMDANGNMALIKVPAYCIPTVKMCLLSPQNYTQYHAIDIEHAYSGNANFMQLQIAMPAHQPGKQTSTVMVHANICMGARLPFLAGSCHLPTSSKEHFKTCDSTTQMQRTSTSASSHPQSVCVSQNIYDTRNKNLSDAQWNLKLDHNRLGHVGFQRLQHLCAQERQLPEFDGVPSVTKPCLTAKDPKQITCPAPVCATCMAACMRKHPHGAKHSKPDPDLENILHSGDLKPGCIISVDQYESSVCGQLPSTRG